MDERALLDALQSGHVGGAGLDVFASEPVTKDTHALVGLDTVICTPHIAWFSQQSVIEMRQSAAKAVHNIMLGKPLRNVVNKHDLE